MYQKIFKRIFDVILSFILIILLIPAWIPICLILLFSGEHSVFYVQKRVGYKGSTFNIWKHRTMLKNSEKMHGGLYTIRNDPRILPFGTFLRRTKLDEIPQLFHILAGKMSFVGPRPLVVDNPYPKELQDRIYNIKPGVTGIGSLIFRNEERLLTETNLEPEEFYANHILPYKAELELWYQEHASWWIDTKIMFCTVYVLFFPDSRMPFMLFNNIPPAPGDLKLIVA